MVSIIDFIVLITSIIVYLKTRDVAQATIALTAGLLTLFTVSWTPAYFSMFFVSWVGLLCAILIIGSISIAAKQEAILTHASHFLHPKQMKDVAALRRVIDKVDAQGLGPIEKAEVVRILTFRKVTLDDVGRGLSTVATLSMITQISYKRMALCYADMSTILNETPTSLTDTPEIMFKLIRDYPSSPDEFIDAFMNSRRIVLSGQVAPQSYFKQLTEAATLGVPPEGTYTYMQERLDAP